MEECKMLVTLGICDAQWGTHTWMHACRHIYIHTYIHCRYVYVYGYNNYGGYRSEHKWYKLICTN